MAKGARVRGETRYSLPSRERPSWRDALVGAHLWAMPSGLAEPPEHRPQVGSYGGRPPGGLLVLPSGCGAPVGRWLRARGYEAKPATASPRGKDPLGVMHL